MAASPPLLQQHPSLGQQNLSHASVAISSLASSSKVSHPAKNALLLLKDHGSLHAPDHLCVNTLSRGKKALNTRVGDHVHMSKVMGRQA